MARCDDLTIIVDTREQNPIPFPKEYDGGKKVKVIRSGLPTGDYSIEGYGGRKGERRGLCIERKKSWGELLTNLTHERERFEKELCRMKFFDRAIVVVEEPFHDLYNNNYRNMIPAKTAWANVCGTIMEDSGIGVVGCFGREHAEEYIFEALLRFHRTARHRYVTQPKGARAQPVENVNVGELSKIESRIIALEDIVFNHVLNEEDEGVL